MNQQAALTRQALRTPRAAAVAGIIKEELSRIEASKRHQKNYQAK